MLLYFKALSVTVPFEIIIQEAKLVFFIYSKKKKKSWQQPLTVLFSLILGEFRPALVPVFIFLLILKLKITRRLTRTGVLLLLKSCRLHLFTLSNRMENDYKLVQGVRDRNCEQYILIK